MNLGFIGLGIMGRPMAGHLIRGGHTVYLNSRSGVPTALIDAGGVACASPADVAQSAEIVFTMVPDTPDVEKVLFAENGVAACLRPGMVVVDMSTISPGATRDFARRVEAMGGQYLDAPVSGGQVGAEAASLTIMVGGPLDAFDRVVPLFQLLGSKVTRIGNNGDGQITKLANNMVVALNIEAVAEALVFAGKAGADPAKVREALMGGFAASRVLEVHGERMLTRNFEPGFRIELHQKDLNLALTTARGMACSLPNTATVQQIYNACLSHGGGKMDVSAMVLALETLANHQVGEPPA